MPDSQIKGYEIITPLGGKVTWERLKYIVHYWVCSPSNKFLSDKEIDEHLVQMKSFGCQVIIHYDQRKQKDTIVIPDGTVTIECGVMVKQFVPSPTWQRTEFITKSIHQGLWWRGIMKSGENNDVLRAHEKLDMGEVLTKLNRRKRLGEEIRFYDGYGKRIYD